MTEAYIIVENVRPPETNSKYPFAQLNVGASFIVKEKEAKIKTVRQACFRASIDGKHFYTWRDKSGGPYTGYLFVTRKS